MILLTLSRLLHKLSQYTRYFNSSIMQLFAVVSSVAEIRQTSYKKGSTRMNCSLYYLHFLSTYVYMYYVIHGKIMGPFMVYRVPPPLKCLPGQYSLANNVPPQWILPPLEQGWALSSATLVGGKTSSFLKWPYKPHRPVRLWSVRCSWHTNFSLNLCRVSLSVLTWGKKPER